MSVSNWLSLVSDYGCVVTGESQVQVHHVLGRSYKHNKVLIGKWYVLPLAIRYHDVHSDNAFNVTHWPKRFYIEFGYQRDLFALMCKEMQYRGIILPFGRDVYNAIQDSPLR